MQDYVTVERRALREAIERAEADACSCVVAVHRETAEQRQAREFWARADAKRQMSKQARTHLRLVSQR